MWHAPASRSLASVASWADDIKFTARPDTKSWHLVDIPVNDTTYDAGAECKTDSCIIAALDDIKSQLACAPDDAGKRDALRFAVHFLGEGPDGTGADFDFCTLPGRRTLPASWASPERATWPRSTPSMSVAWATDPGIKSVDKRKFRNYYALRASVAFSLGSHDEWNIVRAINEKRRTVDKIGGITRQLAVFFDGRPVPPGLYETPVAPGDVGMCAAH
jgi:S1/P1 nuclease